MLVSTQILCLATVITSVPGYTFYLEMFPYHIVGNTTCSFQDQANLYFVLASLDTQIKSIRGALLITLRCRLIISYLLSLK